MQSPKPLLVRLFVVALIAALIGGSNIYPIQAAAGSAALTKTKADIAETRKRLEAAKGKAAEIAKEVSTLDRQVTELNRQIETGEHDISSLESDIRTMQAQIDEVQAQYKKAADASNARARNLYVRGPADTVAMFFSVESIGELNRVQFLMEKSSEQDSKIIVDTSRLRADLMEKQGELNNIKNSLTAQKDWLRQRKALADSARKDRTAALSSVQAEVDREQRHMAGLEADSKRLEAEIRRASAPPSSSSGGGNTTASSSGFIRPVPGAITSGFGRRWGRAHTGVDMAGRTGTPIRAAKAGRVLGVSCGSGYGLCTVIDHGGGVTTLYAHMSRKLVSSGNVERGQVIGHVGCSGSCTGPHLHFEVRVNGTPQNPTRYI